jgi:hypothetical protein
VAISIEILKQTPDLKGVLVRSLLSVILLLSFPLTFDSIAMLGDSLSEKIRAGADIWKFLDDLQEKTMDLNFNWLNLKSGVLFVLNMLSYFISYLGFFFTNAIIHFIWAVLYILSPLMILMVIFKETTRVTSNLYSNLLKVISWKVLYTLLSVLLIKFIQAENLHFGDDNFITTIVINLCVGISMLFIPLFSNSLFGNALSAFSTGLAMGATYPIAGVVKTYARTKVASTAQKTGVMAKRVVKEPPVFAYNKAKDHFHQNRERKRQISYTGGLMPKDTNLNKNNKKDEHAKRKK